MLIKLPYESVICVLSFRLPANIAWLFWKTNEAEWWEINDVWQLYVSSRTFNNEKPISVAILSGNFPSYPILSKLALFFSLCDTYAFILVVSEVMCVFSGETEFWTFSAKTIELGWKIVLSFKKQLG